MCVCVCAGSRAAQRETERKCRCNFNSSRSCVFMYEMIKAHIVLVIYMCKSSKICDKNRNVLLKIFFSSTPTRPGFSHCL